MDYLVSKVALMVTGIALSQKDRKHYTFCLFFFYLWAVFKLLCPPASALGYFWYWVCIGGEVGVIFVAWKLGMRAALYIIAASTIQILANSISIWSNVLYSFYPSIIKAMEITQCVVLIIWSPVSLRWLTRLRTHLITYKGQRWMRKQHKQLQT